MRILSILLLTTLVASAYMAQVIDLVWELRVAVAVVVCLVLWEARRLFFVAFHVDAHGRDITALGGAAGVLSRKAGSDGEHSTPKYEKRTCNSVRQRVRSRRAFDNIDARRESESSDRKIQGNDIDSTRGTRRPAFPSGWFRVAASADLAASGMQSSAYVPVAGQHIAVFRSAEATLPRSLQLHELVVRQGWVAVGAVDAYCKHIGANLGIGGEVDDSGSLVCPFHGWAFAPDGQCTNIPYTDYIPRAAHTRAWTCAESSAGTVFLWYDAQQRPASGSMLVPLHSTLTWLGQGEHFLHVGLVADAVLHLFSSVVRAVARYAPQRAVRNSVAFGESLIDLPMPSSSLPSVASILGTAPTWMMRVWASTTKVTNIRLAGPGTIVFRFTVPPTSAAIEIVYSLAPTASATILHAYADARAFSRVLSPLARGLTHAVLHWSESVLGAKSYPPRHPPDQLQRDVEKWYTEHFLHHDDTNGVGGRLEGFDW